MHKTMIVSQIENKDEQEDCKGTTDAIDHSVDPS